MDADNHETHALSQKCQQQLDDLLAAAEVIEEAEGSVTIDHAIGEEHLYDLGRLVNDVGYGHFVGSYNAAGDEISVGEAKEIAGHHAAMVVALSMLRFGLDFPGTAQALLDAASEDVAEQAQTVATEIYNHLSGRCGCDK